MIDPRTWMVEGVLVEGDGSDTTLEEEWPHGCWYSKVYCNPAVPFAGVCDDNDGTGAKVVWSSVFAEFVP